MKVTILFCSLLLIIALLAGCIKVQTPPDATGLPSESVSVPTEDTLPDPAAQRLKLSCQHTWTDDFEFSKEDLGGNFDCLYYNNVKYVTLELNNEVVKLEEAIRDGLITVEELIAYARLDARNGYCVESFRSENGLAWLTYTYDETCEINYLYDVYESPNGTQHLLERLEITRPGYFSALDYFFVDEETGLPLSLEDWGLEFEVIGYEDGKLTIACTQSGGQQIGKLFTNGYAVVAMKSSDYVKPKAGKLYKEDRGAPTELARETATVWVVDLNESYDPLPPGTYDFQFSVIDIYDPEDVHPLMRNYRDHMNYGVEFVVP